MSTAKRESLSIPGGPKYSYLYQAAQHGKPTFLLLHGFPSSSYDWRKQIVDLGAAGYGVLAPDLLGYGGTDKPDALEEYACSNVAGHVAKILEHKGLTQVIGLAHDWFEHLCPRIRVVLTIHRRGSVVLSRLWNYQPQYLSSLIFASVSYQPPGPFDLDGINALTEQLFGYTSECLSVTKFHCSKSSLGHSVWILEVFR